MVDEEKLQNSMETVEQLKIDNLCANEKILILKEQLVEAKGEQDVKVVLLTSKIEENEHAIRESNERASSFERECKELKEKVTLLQEEVDVLELVCEKMYSSRGCGGMDELEGLEIDGAANCFRSQLESLTNMDEGDDDNDDASIRLMQSRIDLKKKTSCFELKMSSSRNRWIVYARSWMRLGRMLRD